jgi:hypothetical protein
MAVELPVVTGASWLEKRAVSVNVLGIPVCAVDLRGAVDLIDDAIRVRQSLQIGVINAAKVVNMSTDAVFREAVLSSDVIFADGLSPLPRTHLEEPIMCPEVCCGNENEVFERVQARSGTDEERGGRDDHADRQRARDHAAIVGSVA